MAKMRIDLKGYPIPDMSSNAGNGMEIPFFEELPPLDEGLGAREWNEATPVFIDSFHPKSSEHHPKTVLRLLHDGRVLHGFFRVEDRYVIARHETYFAPVYEDSCVEVFLEPVPGLGYFNFEFNCIGAFLSSYITDPRRRPEGGFERFERLPWEVARQVEVWTSLKGPIIEERKDFTVWTVAFRIPLTVFEIYVGELGTFRGAKWRGNFYKCADRCSHPHWGAWAPIGETLNFHQPDRFQSISFM
jgi:hypothetical protein